jgi:hypothetical protein
MNPSGTVLWKTYYNNKKELKWREWLHTLVYIDFRDDSSVVKRFQSFQYFINEGLIPFVKAHGYIFQANIHLANDLANILYNENRQDFCRQPFSRERHGKNINDLDLDYYLNFGISKDDWDTFWHDWQWMTDFYDDNFRNRLLLPSFVYNRLDLENSPVTDKITRELEEEDEYDDMYIPAEQASEAIGQGKDRNSLY